MMTNSNWELHDNGVKLLLLFGLNGKVPGDCEYGANEYLTDKMPSAGYMKLKQMIIRIQELGTKENDKNFEEEDLYMRLKVENEGTIAPYMVRNDAAEPEEEDLDVDVDVEDDMSEGYRDEEGVE